MADLDVRTDRAETAQPWHTRLRPTFGVRARSALLASIVVAAGLSLGAIVLLNVFSNRLWNTLDQTLVQQAEDRAALLETGAAPESVVGLQNGEGFVWIGRLGGEQIVARGHYLPVGDPLPGVSPPVETYRVLVTEGGGSDDGSEREYERFRLVSSYAESVKLNVVIGGDVEQIERATNQLARLFTLAIPFIVVLVGGLTWLTTGRALRPVESIRSQAEAVSGSNLASRVPVPPGKDEIHKLALTMNDMLGRLERHQQSQRQFTADASHELKSPVANLRALVETSDLDTPRWPALRTKLTAESDRLRDLVDNLLFLASHGDADAVTETKTVHLDDILFDEAELLGATGRVRADIGGVEPTSVTGEAGALRRMIRNLVDNAARHADERVTLSCTNAADGTAELVVADDGPGIPVGLRETVFERFSRLDDARARDAGGSGLGLAIVKQIADQHRATIAINDTPGGGATFTVTIPPSSAMSMHGPT